MKKRKFQDELTLVQTKEAANKRVKICLEKKKGKSVPERKVAVL